MGEAKIYFDRLVGYIGKLWDCYLWGAHDWTSAAQEGKRPTMEQLSGGISGYYDYLKMYCKRCGKESDVSRLAKERAEKEGFRQ